MYCLKKFFVRLMLLILHVNAFDDNGPIVDVRSLTSLPLEGLLNIKRNMVNLEMLEGDKMDISEANSTASGKLNFSKKCVLILFMVL